MQRQFPQHHIRISIISPIFHLALISRSEKQTTIFTMPPILKPACRRDGDVAKSLLNLYYERARSEFLLIYTKNLSMSGPPARRPWSRF